MKYILSLVFSCIVLFSTYTRADIFPITIRSVYLDARTGQWGKDVRWNFTEMSNGRVQVAQEGTRDPVVFLEYDQSRRLTSVEKQIGLGHKKVRVPGTPLGPIVLSEGFPVPYDDLATYDDSIEEMVIKKRAGGVIFSYRVIREIRSISLNQAMTQNMVDEKMARDLSGKALRLITVQKGGAFLVRQLWPDGASWWVYEETPVRKSWRVQFR